MEKYIYSVTYSFDPDRYAVGPFSTWEEAWAAMLKDAKNEKRIDTEENGWDAQLCVDKEAGDISLSVQFCDHTDVTRWLLHEMRKISK